jgi:hypothetical protein
MSQIVKVALVFEYGCFLHLKSGVGLVNISEGLFGVLFD